MNKLISDFGFSISDLLHWKIRNPQSATEPKASSAKPIRNSKSPLGDLGVGSTGRVGVQLPEIR